MPQFKAQGCPRYRGNSIAFITEPVTVRHIVTRLGGPVAPPLIAPARGPRLWEAAVPALIGHAPPGIR